MYILLHFKEISNKLNSLIDMKKIILTTINLITDFIKIAIIINKSFIIIVTINSSNKIT